jgi:cell division protein FtsB
MPADFWQAAPAGKKRTELAGMYPEPEARRHSLGGAVVAAGVIALMCYLTFAALQGEQGLFRLFQIEAEETRLRAELADLQAERAAMANKTERLSGRLDLDLLDEQARKVLGLARPDELLIR